MAVATRADAESLRQLGKKAIHEDRYIWAGFPINDPAGIEQVYEKMSAVYARMQAEKKRRAECRKQAKSSSQRAARSTGSR